MADYKTPGVYIEEVSNIQPSVGQVPTALPAFVGYTQKASKNGKSLKNIPTLLSSFLDFKALFGGAYEADEITVALDDDKNVMSVNFDKDFYLFNSMRMFYANGGGQCIIVSVGSYDEDVELESLEIGLTTLVKEELPTILVIPDAMALESKDECYLLQKQMLEQCNKMQDRVAVFDIYDGFEDFNESDVVLNFRENIGIRHLKYGAAYYPWLVSVFPASFSFKNVAVVADSGKKLEMESLVSNPEIIKNLNDAIGDVSAIKEYIRNPLNNKANLKDQLGLVPKADLDTKKELVNHVATIKNLAGKLLELQKKLANVAVKNEVKLKTDATSVLANIVKSAAAIDMGAGLGAIKLDKEFTEFALTSVKPAPALKGIKDEGQLVLAAKPILKSLFENLVKLVFSIRNDTVSIEDQCDKIVYDNSPLYQSMVSEINIESRKIPTCGAIAGIYAAVDADRGVWKAPANVPVGGVVKPTVKIDNDQQETLNVDLISGKSVNAIRSFTGQGNLVWGARTLAGNDNEWRYISVRRFFNMVEKALKLSTAWAVFESNDTGTWTRLLSSIGAYLTGLWQAGALVGDTAGQAYTVNVGLGSTMTQLDILEGRMIIEVGMAVVRPAEFIIIRFSHMIGGGEE